MTERTDSQGSDSFGFRHRVWLIAVFEAVLVACSLILAWMLRFDFALPNPQLLYIAIPCLVIIRLSILVRFNLLHGWWRYTGIKEAVVITKAVLLGSAAFFLATRYLLQLTSFPRSVYVLESVLTLCLLSGARLCSRVVAESFWHDEVSFRRVAVIGAGNAANMILRELNRPGTGFIAVACFDDDPSKRGIRLHGVPVVGSVGELPQLCERFSIDEIVIAVPSASTECMQRFVDICQSTGLKFKTVPLLRDLISGRVTINQVHDVNLEDLLGREPVRVDLEAVRRHVQDRRVLVTGAAGSIGSELARQISEYAPRKLICVDHNETGMFYLERELLQRVRPQNVVFAVSNIGDCERMEKLCSTHGVDMIFHAAAYKHVPVMESNVQEAVNNNIFGLLRLLNVAEKAGCRTFVMISSDKAVNPTSIMGCTKRVGELILAAWPSAEMRCVSVRFGNVLGSSGSVVTLFQEQLRENRPLTVTHPDIQRFFMTIPEAVALVLQASVIGKHGDIMVLDMGEPLRIVDLARTLAKLSGKPGTEVNIEFTGLRLGEKLFEELFYSYEPIMPTSCEKIKRTHTKPVSWEEVQKQLNELQSSLHIDGADPVRRKLKQMVPESCFPHEDWEPRVRFARESLQTSPPQRAVQRS